MWRQTDAAAKPVFLSPVFTSPDAEAEAKVSTSEDVTGLT